jgi:fimbrial chaperone protein
MLPRSVALLLATVLLAADSDGPSGFFVSPVLISLSPRASTGVLTLRNQNPETARFQLNVFAWEQDTEGKALLTPTRDILFSPPLLILAPKEERKVRLASQTSTGSVEKSYRLLIEQLRSPAAKADSEQGQQLQMLTTLSLPIFLPPPKPVTQGRIESLTLSSPHSTFQLKNTGNVHLQIPAFSILGAGPSGAIVLQRQAPGGYVLAGTARLFKFELSRTECTGLRSLKVEVQAHPEKASGVFEVSPDSCK